MKVIAKGKLDLIRMDDSEYYVVGGKNLGTILESVLHKYIVISFLPEELSNNEPRVPRKLPLRTLRGPGRSGCPVE